MSVVRADQRYYAVGNGRFMTPDPSGSAASDMENPTSWNMYAYVNGDPVNFSDPEGLDCASTPYYYNGKYQGTVVSIIGADSDISTLATAMYTESGHGSTVDVIEYAIGAIIMNRWQFENKFGEHDGPYGQAVVDCATKIKNGDFSGAIGSLQSYANWVAKGRP